MTFKEFFLEKFVGNERGLAYMDPETSEMANAIPNNIDMHRGCLGGIITRDHIWFFDRCHDPNESVGMEHIECYNHFARKYEPDKAKVIPIMATKKGIKLTFYPALNSLASQGFFGYTDLKTFKKEGAMTKMQKFIDANPAIQKLKKNYVIELANPTNY